MPAVIGSPRLIAVAASRQAARQLGGRARVTERQPKQDLHFVGAAEQY